MAVDKVNALKKGKLAVAPVVNAIQTLNGNVSKVAESFGVSRQAIYKFIHAHPIAKEALEDARETMLDTAESILYERVKAGNTAELLFFLKTQGRKRGYIERQEHTGANGEPLQFNAVIAFTVEQELAEWRKQQQQTIAAQSSTTNAA